MSPRILVTGATGFLAGHCVAELLRAGYAVRATVRDAAATGRREHLTALGGDLEFAEADLLTDAGWAEAMTGVEGVLHVASPFPAAPPKHEDDLIRPAVDGTLRVLRHAAAAGVRRVVQTSSTAAIVYGHGDDGVRTEADWTVVEKATAYPKSKVLAERAAWDFAAAHPDGPELVVLNPGMILGPLLGAATSTSHEPVRRLLAREMPGMPKVGWVPVDVRDLAVAHRLALETPAAAGNRYICAGDSLSFADIARVLDEEFGPRGYRIPSRTIPDLVVRTVALFDRGVRLTVPNLGIREQVSAEKARTELGWSMRPVRESIVDTAESLIRAGLAPAPEAVPA
ncbi:SDR family oxidoreductase [Nocardia asteroides]|uniref:SDR family oxidoreductase n=1 Tax=Nocardia asteroides TaxID=1824 RepID=UPI001E561930|nr:aldehyde reductase [Nocardia asteroides]UGT62351.1 aldehyde reductase [Nocardia asteroides]